MKKIRALFTKFGQFGREEHGLTMVEYAVAGALIVVVATAAFEGLGSAVSSKIDFIATKITSAGATSN